MYTVTKQKNETHIYFVIVGYILRVTRKFNEQIVHRINFILQNKKT